MRSNQERTHILAEDKEHELLDVIIVGGGLAGLTVAYKLRHKNILLLEKEENCGGRTISRQMGEYVYNTGAQVIIGNKSLGSSTGRRDRREEDPHSQDQDTTVDEGESR